MDFDIETRGLSKNFGELLAVHDLNLQVPQGTIFGFLGPNGSGKSTTVRMLTGLLEPSAGEVFINGLSLRTSSLDIKRNIGVLPEDLALFDYMTIWEHLLMVGPIYGLERQETTKRAEQLLQHLDLWQSRHTFVNQASFGMKKKCSLAMALLHNPKVLFLDEPFEGIDPISSRNIKDVLLLLSTRGVTVFLTSHILEVVERLVQTFAIILNGEIVCSQSVGAVIESGLTLEELFFQHVGRYTGGEMEWLG
jgi:ABC-2 type transport system ATP-binding protein